MERGVKNISKASQILIDNFLKDKKVPKGTKQITETYANEDDVPFTKIQTDTDTSKTFTNIYERLIRQESAIDVLKQTVQNILHQSTGKQVALISAELEEAISMTSKHRLIELQKKLG